MGNYDEWKQQTPPEFEIEKNEVCQVCEKESDDMRYTGLTHDKKQFNPICPDCQQKSSINKIWLDFTNRYCDILGIEKDSEKYNYILKGGFNVRNR